MKSKYDWRDMPEGFQLPFEYLPGDKNSSPEDIADLNIQYAKNALENGHYNGKPLPDDIRRKLEEQVLFWELQA